MFLLKINRKNVLSFQIIDKVDLDDSKKYADENEKERLLSV